MQMLYAYHTSDNPSLSQFEKELFFSVNNAYHLYHYMLQLVVDIADYAEERIQISRQKHLPTDEERNPSEKFVNNRLIRQIEANIQLRKFLAENKFNRTAYPELIKKLYQSIRESHAYDKYIKQQDSSYKEDKEFLISIYEKEIAPCELLYEILEEQSIYWNDDVEFVISMIIKTIGKFKESEKENATLQPLYKNEEDIDFIKTLFRKAISNHAENRALIDKFTKNWDIERIAFMDIILMELAITEATEIASIPTRVSFNEYIEISKYYSTAKSSTFINGVLDKIIQHLRSENKIRKTGRGLIGEK